MEGRKEGGGEEGKVEGRGGRVVSVLSRSRDCSFFLSCFGTGVRGTRWRLERDIY